MARTEHEGQIQDGNLIHEKGKIQTEVDRVTHSCSALTSRPSSPQEVNKNARKDDLCSWTLRSKKLSSEYPQEKKERSVSCTDLPMEQAPSNKEGESLPGDFEFSRRLIEIARKKQGERKRKFRRQSYKKMKTFKSECCQHHVTRNRKHSQSQLCSEEFGDLIGQSNVSKRRKFSHSHQSCDESANLMGRSDSRTNTEMAFQEQKQHDREMYEYSGKLIALSTRKKRFQAHEHAHCCRCVQSFECFWPRSNLQTIRLQSM